jgi:hypothetical protein
LCDRDGIGFALLHRGAEKFGETITLAVNLLTEYPLRETDRPPTPGQRYVLAMLRNPGFAEEIAHLIDVVKEVHGQYGEDLCWMDIDKIFAAAGLPVPDRSVGDPAAMLKNCTRYVLHMCQGGGGWKSYAELEQELVGLRKAYDLLNKGMESQCELQDRLKQENRELRARLERWEHASQTLPG